MHVEQGESVAVFGPNGAGKTTLLKILAALLRPDAGSVRIGGLEVGRDPSAYRRQVGVISHQPYVYPQLTGRENLEFYARLYGLDGVREVARRALDQMGLSGVADRAASAYSRGMLQRLAVGRALLHEPAVLLLDEPFTGLDDEAREKLGSLLGGLRDGQRTVLLTSHDLDTGLALADRVAVLIKGSLVMDTQTSGLSRDEFEQRYRSACREAAGGATGGARS